MSVNNNKVITKVFPVAILVLILSCTPDTKHQHASLPSCKCPTDLQIIDTAATIVYTFDNGKHLAQWQKRNDNDTFPGHITYKNFMLADCDKGIVRGTWGEHKTCTVEMNGDTLVVKELSYMALTPNLDMLYMPWLIHKYYYNRDSLHHTEYFNAREVHYTDKQIEKAFSRVDTTKWPTYSEVKGTRKAQSMMRFTSQMMLSALSGKPEGLYYFRLVKQKFRPEDGLARRYAEMEEILRYTGADSLLK